MSALNAHSHPDPSDTDTHDDSSDGAHGAHDDHGGDDPHGTADAHGHGAASEPLGPVDTRAWAAAIGGAVLGVIVILVLYLSIQA
jgi:hypothetical protein